MTIRDSVNRALQSQTVRNYAGSPFGVRTPRQAAAKQANADTSPAEAAGPETGAAAGTAVPTFQDWFATVNVSAAAGLPGAYTMNQSHTATPTGAEEALRLVQQFVPGASLEANPFGDGVHYASDKPVYDVVLPNGLHMNAGLILDGYYNRGLTSVTASGNLAQELGHLTGGSVNVVA
jgi:hypothetical protein